MDECAWHHAQFEIDQTRDGTEQRKKLSSIAGVEVIDWGRAIIHRIDAGSKVPTYCTSVECNKAMNGRSLDCGCRSISRCLSRESEIREDRSYCRSPDPLILTLPSAFACGLANTGFILVAQAVIIPCV